MRSGLIRDTSGLQGSDSYHQRHMPIGTVLLTIAAICCVYMLTRINHFSGDGIGQVSSVVALDGHPAPDPRYLLCFPLISLLYRASQLGKKQGERSSSSSRSSTTDSGCVNTSVPWGRGAADCSYPAWIAWVKANGSGSKWSRVCLGPRKWASHGRSLWEL